MLATRRAEIAGGVESLVAAVRRVLSLPPKPTAAEQLAEATRVTEAAARREAADEVMRAKSRKVMREMWPARPAATTATKD